MLVPARGQAPLSTTLPGTVRARRVTFPPVLPPWPPSLQLSPRLHPPLHGSPLPLRGQPHSLLSTRPGRATWEQQTLGFPRRLPPCWLGWCLYQHPWWRVHAGHHLGVLVWLCEGSPDPAQCPEAATSIVHSSPSVCKLCFALCFLTCVFYY